MNLETKIKKWNTTKWKDETWKLFSLFIRLRDADKNGYVTCVTCGEKGYYTGDSFQAGHFIDGRRNAVLFDERLVHVQCYPCNCHKSGNKVSYTLFMLKKHTEEEIAKFEGMKFEIKKWKNGELIELYQKYQREVERLEKQLNI